MSLFHDFQSAMRKANRRRELARPVHLVRLRKDGQPSGMRDSVSAFNTEQEARDAACYVRSLNPGRTLRYAIRLNGGPLTEI